MALKMKSILREDKRPIILTEQLETDQTSMMKVHCKNPPPKKNINTEFKSRL